MIREVSTWPTTFASVTNSEIEVAVKGAERDYRGWPVLYIWNGDEQHVTPDGIECRVKREGLVFFWVIDHSGTLFHHFDYDFWATAGELYFNPVLFILEMAELFVTLADLYRRLKIDDRESITVEVQYSGVKDALIAYEGNPASISLAKITNRRVTVDRVSFKLDIPVSTRETDIAPLVHEAFHLLFDGVTRDMRDYTLESVRDWCNRLVERRI